MPSRPTEERAPGRDTRPASSPRRRTWYGYGEQARVEKGPVNRFLHDTTYVFGEISVVSLPVLFAIFLSPDFRAFGVKTTAFVAWLTMTAVTVTIRGGWVRPLATDTLGWVSLTPTLVALRLLYYNAVLAIAAYGGTAVADALEVPAAALAVAFVVSVLATLAFPRLAESFYRRLTR